MDQAAALAARQLVRGARKASLATLDANSGAPFASMILVATTTEGAPYTLLSSLARHTQNLRKSSAASILIDASNASGDATSGGRITLMGQLIVDTDPSGRRRFIARHPSASHYADFGDFAFFRYRIENAHLIEGFGRIIPLPGAALHPSVGDFSAFNGSELQIVDALRPRWPMVIGVDCEGVDLETNGTPERLTFDETAISPAIAHALAEIKLFNHFRLQTPPKFPDRT